jgi:hypothetical protein
LRLETSTDAVLPTFIGVDLMASTNSLLSEGGLKTVSVSISAGFRFVEETWGLDVIMEAPGPLDSL